MKNGKVIGMLGVSLLAALLAVLLAARWINQQTGSRNSVVVAAMDINPGTRITPDMLRIMEWPADSVPKGSFTEMKALDSRVARSAMLSGEPILEPRLAVRGATGGLSAIVTEGKRAMTVRVNDVVGVAGFALPGNFVDILVSTQNEGKSEEARSQNISKQVLERILVLAVAQEATTNDAKPKVVNAVTLEVTPEQAEKLDLARSVGQLSLVLRNQVDLNSTRTAGATKQSLLHTAGESKPAAATRVVYKPRVSTPAAREETCQQIMTGQGRITQCY
jgi:pilus assembly protein CpaB